MTDPKRLGNLLASRKGEAKPPAEPTIRMRAAKHGRRVGTTLPIDMYVRFKVHVAERGTTGEQVIVEAIKLLLQTG